MNTNKQNQIAGSNSQQIQIENFTLVQGITEQRAREICVELNNTCKEYTDDARELAFARVTTLENKVMDRFSRIEGALEAFKNPAFQYLVASAQKTAAATEREHDYDILTELLVRRTKTNQDRKLSAGIWKAVEIIDKIDDDALCGLTVLFAAEELVPLHGTCSNGLRSLNDIISKLIYMDLPLGDAWIEHLDLLNALKVAPIGNLPTLDNWLATHYDGYVCVGIPIDSDNHKKAIQILTEIAFSPNVLVENELLPGYVRIPVSTKRTIRNLQISRSLSAEEIERAYCGLEEIWSLYSKDSNLKKSAQESFKSLLNEYDAFKTLSVWWSQISSSVYATSVGKIIACANAKIYVPSFPDLQ